MSSLIDKAVRGAVWTIGSSMSGRLVGVIGTLVIIHYLAPSVVGEVGIAHLLVYTVRRLTTIGFGQYVVATKNLEAKDISQISTLHMALGLLGFVFVLLLAKPLAPFFQVPSMHVFIPGLLVSAVIDRFSFMPEKILVRNLRFKAISFTRASTEILYTLVSVGGAALLDLGGHAIVYGHIARSLVTACVFLTIVKFSDWRPSLQFDRTRLKDVFEFGWPLWVSTNANYFSRTWDQALFARFFGAHAVGNYRLAFNLASIPSSQVGEHIGDVLLPSFAKMDAQKKNHALIRATSLLALIIFPLAVGLGTVSQSLSNALLSKEWSDVAPYLTILSVLSVVRPISWNIDTFLQSQRRTKVLMFLGLQKVIVLVACISLLAQVSDLWACVGVGIAFAVHMLASVWVVKRYDDVSTRAMLQSMVGPLLACIPMVFLVLLFRHFVILPPTLQLAVEILIGAIAYVPCAFVFANKTSKDVIKLLKNAFKKRSV